MSPGRPFVCRQGRELVPVASTNVPQAEHAFRGVLRPRNLAAIHLRDATRLPAVLLARPQLDDVALALTAGALVSDPSDSSASTVQSSPSASISGVRGA